MKVKSESEVAQSCLTLSDPMDCSLPGSSIHRLLQARVLGVGVIAFFNFKDEGIINLGVRGIICTSTERQSVFQTGYMISGPVFFS